MVTYTARSRVPHWQHTGVMQTLTVANTKSTRMRRFRLDALHLVVAFSLANGTHAVKRAVDTRTNSTKVPPVSRFSFVRTGSMWTLL